MSHSVEQLKLLNAEVRGLRSAQFRNQPAFRLDCLGHKVFLCRPQQIAFKLQELQSSWQRDLQLAQSKQGLSWAMGHFYFGFQQIHPFMDGNQRTALKFLQSDLGAKQKLRSLGLRLCPNSFLQKIQLEGDASKDVKRLELMFSRWLHPLQ